MYLILRRKQGDALPASLPATLVPSIGALIVCAFVAGTLP